MFQFGQGCTRMVQGGYNVALAEGETLTVTADASSVHDAVLYLFDDCGQPESCVAFGSGSPNPEIRWKCLLKVISSYFSKFLIAV